MFILGLAGPAGVGKDTVADYLVKRYGFVKFAFSDALYKEVQEAFGLEDQSLLRDRATKEQHVLRLFDCADPEFVAIAEKAIGWTREYTSIKISPRQILQWWGTDYRRKQNPTYWLSRATDFIEAVKYGTQYPEHAPQYFVEAGTRFENERVWITDNDYDWTGNIWHIHSDVRGQRDGHESAKPLPVLAGERELWNNDTIERLYSGVDLLMHTQARFVRVEPMAK